MLSGVQGQPAPHQSQRSAKRGSKGAQPPWYKPPPMRLSVVIVNWNSREDLRACLASLREQTHRDLEVIVVDNGSTDGSVEMVRESFPEVVLLAERENLGFAEGCNRGIAKSTGPWVAMLNNDTVADPDWARALVEAAEKAPPDCGMLQSLLLYRDRPDTVNSTGIELTRTGGGRDRDEGTPWRPQHGLTEIFCPTAGAAAYKREMLEAIRLPTGYFDRDHFMYFEDMDLGWRARLAGWSAYFVPDSKVLHTWHGSSKRLGRSWLVVVSRTNRIRTLLKNASLPFLLRTSPKTAYEIAELLWHGRAKAGLKLLGAVKHSVLVRREVERLAKQERRSIEERWVVRAS